jgi:hypothetical protein
VMPYVVGGILAAWMTIYGRHTRRQGERMAAAAQAAASPAPALPLATPIGSAAA